MAIVAKFIPPWGGTLFLTMQKYVLYFSQQTDGIYHNIDENYRCGLSCCKVGD